MDRVVYRGCAALAVLCGNGGKASVCRRDGDLVQNGPRCEQCVTWYSSTGEWVSA